MKLLKIIAYLFAIISIFLLSILLFGLFDSIFNYLDVINTKLLKDNIGTILTGSITIATFILIYLDFDIKSKQFEKMQEEVNIKLDNLKLEKISLREKISKERVEKKLIKQQIRNDQEIANAAKRSLRNKL
mgnify:CR=1 FL=1